MHVACSAFALPAPALEPDDDYVAIASFNMERFFDDTNDPAVGEPVLTPVAYQTRLGKESMAIRDYLHAPDILDVQEMENLTVLQDLAAPIGQHAIAAGKPDPQSTASPAEGNDVGGIAAGSQVSTA